MKRALALEFKKAYRRHLWLVPVGILLFEMLFLIWAVYDLGAEEKAQAWQILFYQASLLNCILMPITISVISSRLCDIEHQGHALRQLRTLIPPLQFFIAKFFFGAIILFTLVCIQLLMLLGLSIWKEFIGYAPPLQIVIFLLTTLAVNLTILLLQQLLSLAFVNQMIAFAAGLLGSLLGLFSLFFPASLQRLFIWSYYGYLSTIVMDWNPETRITNFYYAPINWTGWLTLAAFFCSLLFIGIISFTNKEE